MIAPWISFIIVISLILIFSKYELSLVLLVSTLLFGFLSEVDLINTLYTVIINPSMFLLAIALSLIPILGGIIDESGIMIELIQNMNISKKKSIMLTPAFFGLFPVAGGALMSAPIIDKMVPNINPDRKVAINVWFRHIVILVYPLSPALLLLSELSHIDTYIIVLTMLIPFFLLFIIGYFAFIYSINEIDEKHKRDIKLVLYYIIPLIIAPIIDIVGRNCFDIKFPNLFLIIGLAVSIIVSLKIGHMKFQNIKKISKKMKLWRFPLLIFSIFLFLEIFDNSGIKQEISNLNLPFILLILLSFLLGFVTGELQVPISILIPIYLIQNSLVIMPLVDCIFIYSAIFLGYLMTPLHPCVSYSNDFFKAKFSKVFKLLIVPILSSFILLVSLYYLLEMF